MSFDARTERLECGMDLAALIEQVTDGRPARDAEHQARCRFCQAALTRIREVWEGLRELAAVDVTVPEGLTDAIMRRVRAVPREAPRVVAAAAEALFALLRGAQGATQIGAGVLDEIAARAAGSVPATRVRRVDVEIDAQQRAVIGVHVVVQYGPSIPALVERVRAAVVDHVEALAGVPVASVSVTVEDIEAPPGSAGA